MPAALPNDTGWLCKPNSPKWSMATDAINWPAVTPARSAVTPIRGATNSEVKTKNAPAKPPPIQ